MCAVRALDASGALWAGAAGARCVVPGLANTKPLATPSWSTGPGRGRGRTWGRGLVGAEVSRKRSLWGTSGSQSGCPRKLLALPVRALWHHPGPAGEALAQGQPSTSGPARQRQQAGPLAASLARRGRAGERRAQRATPRVGGTAVP